MYWNFDKIILTPRSPKLTDRNGPIAVEIGFGNGEYLAHLAASRPEWQIIGVEVSQLCVTKAARRALAGCLSNIRLFHGDARYLLRLAFEPCSVTDVFMNFPCPWPKKRHTERRVARPRFASLMNDTLKTGGSFTLATDVDWYAEDTFDVFSSDANFQAAGVKKNPGRDYLTKYERKWLDMGRDTYVMTAVKTGGGEPSGNIPAEGEGGFEPAGAEVAGTIKELALSVKGDVVEGKDYRAIFREVFLAADGTAVILVISVDEGFEQHYYLKLVLANGRIRGKVDSVGHPYKTPGVRASVRHLALKTGAKF